MSRRVVTDGSYYFGNRVHKLQAREDAMDEALALVGTLEQRLDEIADLLRDSMESQREAAQSYADALEKRMARLEERMIRLEFRGSRGRGGSHMGVTDRAGKTTMYWEDQ